MPAHAPSDRPLRRTDRKRLDIVEAAKEEFRSQGFQATSMDRIATRAQVSKRTVYNHFSSKEELFAAIVEELFARYKDAIGHTYDPEAPVEKELEKIAQQEVDTFLSEEVMGLIRVTMAECIRSPELARETFERIQKQENALVVWMKKAKDDGRLSIRDPVIAANQLSALLKSELFWPQIIGGQPAPSRRDCRKVVRATVEMFLARYAPGDPSP